MYIVSNYLNPKSDSKSFLDFLDLEEDFGDDMPNKESKLSLDFLDFELGIPRMVSQPL